MVSLKENDAKCFNPHKDLANSQDEIIWEYSREYKPKAGVSVNKCQLVKNSKNQFFSVRFMFEMPYKLLPDLTRFLNAAYRAFNTWMDEEGYDTKKSIPYYDVFAYELNINSEFATIEDAFANFKMIIKGYLSTLKKCSENEAKLRKTEDILLEPVFDVNNTAIVWAENAIGKSCNDMNDANRCEVQFNEKKGIYNVDVDCGIMFDTDKDAYLYVASILRSFESYMVHKNLEVNRALPYYNVLLGGVSSSSGFHDLEDTFANFKMFVTGYGSLVK